MPRTYEVAERWFIEDIGWQTRSTEYVGEYESAAQLASLAARRLDAMYGASHHWNVYLLNLEGEAYFELFHGRLS